MTKTLNQADLKALQQARFALENPGFMIQAANLIGSPIEHVLSKRLPARATALIERATRAAVTSAFNAAAATLAKDKLGAPARLWPHRAAVIAAGAAGGFFGWAGLALELPFTTATILRSLADIARSHGESPDDLDTRLACIEVLALGGKASSDDGAESGYFATRATLAQQVSAVTHHLASHGLGDRGAPAIARLINAITSRFSIPVGQKAAAEALPIVGALTGAGLNAIFISHFQQMAQGHFTVRRLERKYGAAAVRRAYQDA